MVTMGTNKTEKETLADYWGEVEGCARRDVTISESGIRSIETSFYAGSTAVMSLLRLNFEKGNTDILSYLDEILNELSNWNETSGS